jgi:hypothetical protein
MAKADQLLMMVGGIDLIVGPLLTLLVYKHGKKTLRMDLTVIAVIQAIFLSMGLYTIFQSRPVFLVASSKMFDLVFANEITPERLAKASLSHFGRLSITQPQLVGAKMPINHDEQMAILTSALQGNGDLQNMPQYYVMYQDMIPEILTNAHALQASNKVSNKAIAVMARAANDYGYRPNEVRYMPLASTRGDAAMLISAKTGQVVGPVNLDL